MEVCLTPGDVIFIVILLVLLVLAIYWIWFDYDRLFRMPDIDHIPPEERVKQLQFLACFNFENGPQWRIIYIATIIVGLVLLYVFGLPGHSIKPGILLLLIIFFVFYGLFALQAYHVQRLLCSKAKPDLNAL